MARNRIDDRGLRGALKRGYPVTLVLGAGVSRSRGLPLWPELLQAAWKTVTGHDPYAADLELLDRSRQACIQAGIRPEFVQRLDVVRHPLEFQFGFERIFDNLRWSDSRKRLKDKLKLSRRAKHVRGALSNEQLASEAFAALLRDILYARHDNRQDLRPTDTLSLIARAIRRSALAPGGQGMVRQVITFNVDDLLERVVNARHRRRLLAMPVTRASEIAHLANRKCVGVYHLHGFVPQNATRYPYRTWDGGVIEDVRLPVESLVFTDEQYWQTVGSPGGFASRIFAQALSGTCVFVGLSMTDINILRWLAQHATEVKREFRLMTAGWTNADEAEFDASEEISRHFWITEQRFDKHLSLKSDFGLGVLRSVLQNRGVDIIEIPSWTSKEFHEWWKAVFLS